MSEQPDGPVVAVLTAAAIVAIAIAWWATDARRAPDEVVPSEAVGVEEPGTPQGPPGDAPVSPAPTTVEAPAGDAPGAPGADAPGGPDAAIADAAPAAPEAEFEDQDEPAPGAPPGASPRPAPRELGTRGASGPGGDSPVRVRLAGDQGMPVPMEVAPPRPGPRGPLRTPPRPDPSPIPRPRTAQ